MRGSRALCSRSFAHSIFFSVGAVGYIILIANDPKKLPGLSYFAIYLAAIGIYCQISNIVALTSGNAEGAYKRSVLTAIVIVCGLPMLCLQELTFHRLSLLVTSTALSAVTSTRRGPP